MTAIHIKENLLKELDKLTPEDQQRLLEYARKLTRARVKGIDGANVVKDAAGINTNDLRKMKKTIEEGCERINPDEW